MPLISSVRRFTDHQSSADSNRAGIELNKLAFFFHAEMPDSDVVIWPTIIYCCWTVAMLSNMLPGTATT